jgi:hypothetical protein
LSAAVAVRRATWSRGCVGLSRGGVAPRLPQAGGRALLVRASRAHPIVLGRGETPRRAAVPRGGDAPSPGLWSTGHRAVVLLRQALNDRVCPGRPHPSAPRPRPRRGNARRAGPRRRVARRSGNLGVRPSCRGTCLAAGLGRREPGSSAPQRMDQARRATGRSTEPWRRRIPTPRASRRAFSPSPAGRCLAWPAVQEWDAEATRPLAPQRDEGMQPADGALTGAWTRRVTAGWPGISSNT